MSAQTKRTTQTKKTTTTATRKKSSSRTSSRSKKKTTAAKKTAQYSNASIKGLQSKRSKLQKDIRQQEKALRNNKADVQKRLKNLMTINSEIDKHEKNIRQIESEIKTLDNNIRILNAQLKTLESQLKERKAKYIKSMRYITRRHTVQDRLMFIFSAESFTQMYRRLRFIREYAEYQKAQGEW